MSSHHHKHAAVIRFLFFVCLFCSGADLEAQIEVPTPAAPSKSTEASSESELKLHNYQLKHAQAAAVLKMWQQLHGIVNGVTIDERTNSIVFLANEAAAREALETLALLDSETPSSIVQGPSPAVRVPAKAESPYARLPFRKFTFKHANAADVLKILLELAGSTNDVDSMEGFVVDERTNSIIWKVNDVWDTQNSEEMCAVLDAESPVSASKFKTTPSPVPNRPTPASGSPQPTQTFTFSIGFERVASPASLKQRYNELEQQAHQLADKLKQSKSPSESERRELQLAVRKSFEARQVLQRAELADLARCMKSMQQSIDMRDKLTDKVVQRRVEDLLDPNLKWDISEPAIAETRSSIDSSIPTPYSASRPLSTGQSDQASLPRSLAPTSDSVPYVPGEQLATIIKERMQGRWGVESASSGNEVCHANEFEQVILQIKGNTMQMLKGTNAIGPPILLADCKDIDSSQVKVDGPLPIDLVFDPNGDPVHVHHGLIACDGETLSICMAGEPQTIPTDDFRPAMIGAGAKVTLWKCRRAPDDIPHKDPLSSESRNDQLKWDANPSPEPSSLSPLQTDSSRHE